MKPGRCSPSRSSCMVILIGMVGFAVDVGHAYLVQRQLQSGVDAAALAGAQELPDPAAVTTVAKQYGPNSTKNPPTAIDNAQTTVDDALRHDRPGLLVDLQHVQRGQGQLRPPTSRPSSPGSSASTR